MGNCRVFRSVSRKGKENFAEKRLIWFIFDNGEFPVSPYWFASLRDDVFLTRQSVLIFSSTRALVAMHFLLADAHHWRSSRTMPQQNECFWISSTTFVSDIDYSEAQTILELTANKQRQLRRQRSQTLHKQILLKRTHTLVCELLDSECSTPIGKSPSSPLSTVDTNKRKLLADDHDDRPTRKKSSSLMDRCYDITNDQDVLQFLRELNSVKIVSRYWMRRDGHALYLLFFGTPQFYSPEL